MQALDDLILVPNIKSSATTLADLITAFCRVMSDTARDWPGRRLWYCGLGYNEAPHPILSAVCE